MLAPLPLLSGCLPNQCARFPCHNDGPHVRIGVFAAVVAVASVASSLASADVSLGVHLSNVAALSCYPARLLYPQTQPVLLHLAANYCSE
ncbi:unnamed protein product [Penicillium roqueforti FM164]|uniref:Genomic scaffold, ProqFM164S02 n=1 Tax=Penicillium roqueforti (strain FM164) TaxID=1365484 RepID=W6Q0U6_PENRF|nr:unnamed protein product [Penicillium roqueforti FM164]